nr:MAG TPA: repressor protein [Caudoviricetes sp.]
MQALFKRSRNFGIHHKNGAEIMSDLYSKIESLCHEKGITITTMCRECGASRGSLTDLKQGRKKRLNADTLSKIAAYFGVSVDYLLGNEQKEKPVTNPDDELNEYLEELKNRDEMKMLFSLAKGATKEDVEKAVKIIEALMGK